MAEFGGTAVDGFGWSRDCHTLGLEQGKEDPFPGQGNKPAAHAQRHAQPSGLPVKRRFSTFTSVSPHQQPARAQQLATVTAEPYISHSGAGYR